MGSLTCAPTIPLGKPRSICDLQQLLPLPEFALEPHALRNPKRRFAGFGDTLFGTNRGGKQIDRA